MIKKTFGIILLLIGSIVSRAQSEADSPQVFFRVGSAVLNVEDIPQAFVDSAVAVCARGEKYAVTGVASPEGSQAANARLALRRANAIVKGLIKRTGLPDSSFCIKTLVADVVQLRDLVAQDDMLPSKDEVMAVLNENLSAGGALAKLKPLHGGTPYLYIKNRLFPYLRTSVGTDRDSLDFHPDLKGRWQPDLTKQIAHSPIQTHKAIPNHTSEPERRNAVTLNDKSRLSSSHGGTVSENIGLKDTVKQSADSLQKVENPAQAAKTEKTKKIETSEKTADWNWLFWIVIILLLLILAVVVVVARAKIIRLQRELGDAKHQLNIRDRQIREMEEKQSSLYNDGEALFNHLLIGGVTYEWTNEQISTLIEHYKLQNYRLIHSLETEYDNLPLNHILFEILVDMGKSDAEIQRMMNISQTTIRTYRFRIKNKKLK